MNMRSAGARKNGGIGKAFGPPSLRSETWGALWHLAHFDTVRLLCSAFFEMLSTR